MFKKKKKKVAFVSVGSRVQSAIKMPVCITVMCWKGSDCHCVVDMNRISHKIQFTDDTEPHARTYLYSYPKSLFLMSERFIHTRVSNQIHCKWLVSS